MENNKKLVKLKVIFVDVDKHDGGTFKVMKTIINDGGKDKWVEVRFGDAVNTKIWKNENQMVYAPNITLADGSKNIRIPKSFEPFTSKKDGKKRYPYIFISEIEKAEKLVYKSNPSNNYVDADTIDFNIDEEDTDVQSSTQEDYNQDNNEE